MYYVDEKSMPNSSRQNINTASGSTSGAATPPIPRDKSKIGSGTTTPGEDWELDCEICGAKGTNQVSTHQKFVYDTRLKIL